MSDDKKMKKEAVTDQELTDGSGVAGLAGQQLPLTDEQRLAAVREMIRNKVREVVRKKAGGGGFVLYAPNKGKKGTPRGVGTFPTKLGAKRAELARFPPKDPGKLKRLRREVDRLGKDPKKAAEREKTASKQKGTDKGSAGKTPKKESLMRESPFTTGGSTPSTGTTAPTSTNSTSSTKSQVSKDPKSFMTGLKAIPKDQQNQRVSYVQNHLADPTFVGMIKKQQGGDQIIKQLYGIANDSAKMKPGQTKTTALGTTEHIARQHDFMERKVLSTVVKKSLREALFREEKVESEWDDYIGRLSKQAAADSKLGSLQKNISKKTEGILGDAFDSIRKSVGKNVKLKSFGVKHDTSNGKVYLPFSAEFEDVTAEPIYIHIEGGVPKIELSTPAKVALTKADPQDSKLFRAELVTVQERVLDEMDDLSRAIENRDKYLKKLEGNVDTYVAGLTGLEISLLKNLLVKKYRKSS